jgi:3-demethoxyubiquinol 3-hydroxylase
MTERSGMNAGIGGPGLVEGRGHQLHGADRMTRVRRPPERTPMLLPSRDPRMTVKRILKVNHAGETGAIRIYAAQIAVAKRLFPHIVPELEEMRADEIEHERLFREAMPARRARPCWVMSLWKLGGYVLGFATALMGERMVWVCTEAVEATVHRHLQDQLFFLKDRDPELHALILSIQEQEMAHLADAREHQGDAKSASRSAGNAVIGFATDVLIWLSTWGDSTWMSREMRAAR